MLEHRTRQVRCTPAAICLALLWAAEAGANIRVFPNPAGDNFPKFDPVRVSADGSTLLADWYVTDEGSPPAVHFYAAVWRLDAQMRILQLPGPIGEGFAGDISADGRRVVVTAAGEQPREGYLWTEDGGFTRLGLPVVGRNSFATAIARNGAFAAGSPAFAQELRADGVGPAQRWPGAASELHPMWISDDGERVAGQAVAASGGYAIFRGDRSGSHQLLERALAGAVASDGAIAGMLFHDGAEGWDRPFIWVGEEVRFIPGLEGEVATPVGVAASGTAAVGSSRGRPDLTPWYWSDATGLLSVQEVLVRANGPLGSLGIGEVFWLSDDGLTIAGTGYDASLGQAVVWIGTVPSVPAAVALLPLLSFGARRVRR